MAKRNLKTPVIAGVALTIVILTPLLLLFAGIEVPIVGKAYADALGIDIAPQEDLEGFEIPFDGDLDKINDHNQNITDTIIDIGTCNTELLAMDEELCNEEKDMVGDLEDDLIIIDPVNMTETSEDPPITQICDQLDLGCGSEIMELKATLTKTNALGNQTVVTESFGIPSLSFLADPTDFDLRDGKIELALELNTKRSASITSNGSFEVFLNGQSILTEPIPVRGDGVSDENGILPMQFISPTGIPSNTYTFDFGSNFDKFVNEQINPLELRLLNYEVSRSGDMFAIFNQTVVNLDIERDDIKILVLDEEFGTFDRVYPADSRVIVNTVSKTLKSISGDCAGVVVTTAKPPQIGRIDVFDSNDELVGFSNGGSGLRVLDQLVTRNANYTMTIFFPTGQTSLEYGKSQETKTFSCESKLAGNTCEVTCSRWQVAGGRSGQHCSSVVASWSISTTPVCNLP
jgi:hypothetical protein